MHEVRVAQSVLNAVEARIEEPRRVREVLVRLGPFCGVDADALRFAFEVLAPESRCPHARLAIETLPAAGDCPSCGNDQELPTPGPVCPRCGAILTAVRGDDEITLVSVALSVEEARHAGS